MTISKKAILFLFSTLITCSQLVAQVAGGKEQKLFDMYVMGEYEKCADRAMKMTENDKTKYDSEPYLYVALSMLKINDDPELAEYYPDALRDALKYAAKFTKRDDRLRDKEEEYILDQNMDHINMFKEIALREGKGYFVQEDYRKAVYYYKLGQKIDPRDPVMQMIKGVGDLYSRNTRTGQEEIDEAIAKFKEQAQNGTFEKNESTVMAFEDAFIYYGEYLKEKGDRTEAQMVAKLARELDPKNAKFERLQENVGG